MDIKVYKEKLLERKEELLKILENLQNEFREISSCDIKEDADFASCSTNSDSNFYLYNQQKMSY